MRQRVSLLIHLGRDLTLARFLYGFQQLVECVCEQADAVVGQFVSNLFHRNAHLGKRFHRVLGGFNVFRQTVSQEPMIAECVQGRRWHGIYGVWPYQFLHIEHITIIGILGAGAGPKHALCLCSLGSERLPTRAAENLLVALISQLAVGDRHLAQNALQ